MPSKPKATVKPHIEVPLDVPSASNPRGVTPVYANNLGLSATLTDFTLLFTVTGQWPGPNAEAVGRNELVAAVTMPPMAAVGVIEAMRQFLKTFQEHQDALAQAMRKDGESQK